MKPPEGVDGQAREALDNARLWQGASQDALDWLSRTSRVATYEKGDLLFRMGEVPDDVALIVEGHGRSVVPSDGRRSVVETFWPGDVIGPIAALSETCFESDVQALEHMTVVLIPVDALKDLLSSEPSVALSVISELSRRWVDALNTARRATFDVASRLIDYLERLPRTRLGQHAYCVELPVQRNELAELLGTTPETLSRTFRMFDDAGLVETHARLIVVPDGRALARYTAEREPGPDDGAE